MGELFIGLMSGTSVDGIDAALVDFSASKPKLLASYYQTYSSKMREDILSLCQSGEDEINRMGEMDILLGKTFAEAVNTLLQKNAYTPDQITAIGSHGQTIRHHPNKPYPFTLQIGDPNTIATHTGITTIADFRRRDMVVGGQGAPLVPAYHQAILASDQTNRVIVNIGGIANITLLPKNKQEKVLGFDTGPGNVLMDAWITYHQQKPHDEKGAWASTGCIHENLLSELLADDYFKLMPPKSTGREYFNLEWLKVKLNKQPLIAPADIQATLAMLTAQSIIDAIKQHFNQADILVCGGGTHNDTLMHFLRHLAEPNFRVDSTQKFGVEPDWVEAMAFAWLAQQTLKNIPSNLPQVTGARAAVVLGGIYPGLFF